MGWEPARSQNRMNPSQPVCWACELRCGTSSARHPPHPPEPGPLHLLAPGQISGTDERLLIWPHLEQMDHNRSMDYWKQGMTGAMVLFVKLETSHSLSHKLLGRWFPILARIRLRQFPPQSHLLPKGCPHRADAIWGFYSQPSSKLHQLWKPL